jgi:hypothetical protein
LISSVDESSAMNGIWTPTSEVRLWEKLRPYLGTSDRMEHKFQKGVSDVVYELDGIAGWLELKMHPKPPGTPFWSELKPEQGVFLRRWGKANVPAHLLMGLGSTWTLFKHNNVVVLNHKVKLTVAEFVATADAKGEISDDGFKRLAQILQRARVRQV